MSTKKKDPLLITARLATIVVRIGLAVGMIGLGLAAAAAIMGHSLFGDHLIVEVSPSELNEITGAVVVVIGIIIVSLGLMYDFVTRLAQIIDTVGLGDPFTLANAARLKRMAWLAIIVQLLGIPATLLGSWLKPQLDSDSFQISSDVSLTGFGLAIVLFILARVFLKGAEMRDELEGTV